ncbi:MAG TPA: glycosyltransferase family 39 protein [Oligoflexia bacterium]|nr:glycosyltransferase family 39 protein [Oligoflexia bacterium]HMR24503.1 glycosyltransferase family 39 protein [Oligoflexia bacterium]
MTKRLFIIAIGAVSVLGFLLRFFMSIDPSIWADEGQHVWIVGVNHWYEMRKVYETTAHDQPFGLYLALYLWKNIFGWSQVAMRCFSVFFSSISIPVIAGYAYKLFDKKSISIVAALLLCFSPVSVRYGYDITPYAFVQFFAVISTGQFLYAIKTEKYGFSMQHVLINMCLLNIHYFSYFFVFAQTVVFLFFLYKSNWELIVNKLIYPCLFYVFASLPMLLLFNPVIAKGNHWWIGLENKNSLAVFSNLILYKDVFAWLVLSGVIGLLIRKQYLEKKTKNLVLSYSTIALNGIMLLTVFVAGIFTWKVSGNERYYIALLPSIVLLFSFLFMSFEKKHLAYIFCTLVIGLFIYDAYKNLPRQNYQDFDSALNFVRKDSFENNATNEIIFIPECCRWGIYYYQAQKKIAIKSLALSLVDFINNQSQSESMINKLKAEGYQKIYTLLYYESLKHKQRVINTMNQYARLTDEKKFKGVSVLVHSIE